MMGTYEIYTVGGGYYLYAVFNYIAAFTSGVNFKIFMSIGITIGMIGLVWKILWGAGLREVLAQVLLMMAVGLVGFGIKSRVVIIDPTAGTIPIYGTVDNVPWSIAALGYVTSSMSYELTGQMEALLSTPTNVSYQQSGMLFGATLMSQAANWRAVSPKIHELLVNYTQGCVIDATLLGHMDLEEVASTGNLDQEISANMPQSLAYYDPVTGETQTCAERWTAVRGIITTEVDKVLAHKAAAMFPNRDATGGSNVAKLKGTLSDFQNMMGMSSTSAVGTIKQAMLLTAMDDATRRFIATSGNDAAMALYQAARTDVQTKASYSATGVSALRWVPLLKIVLEVLYYGCFPLALFMMMTPMGLSVVKGYTSGFVWLASWGPISAVLHMIVLESASGYYRSAGATTTDGTVNDVVLSLSNLYQMQGVEADVGSVAGYLMMSVPFLATAIMFGAGKMTSMATSLLNVGQGVAIDTGREAATGNLSLGNVSMNNMAANKWNTSSVVDQGRYTGYKGNGASYTINEDGSTTYGKGTAISEFGANATLENSVRNEVSQRAESSKTAAATATRELSSFISGAASSTLGFVNSVMASKGSGETGTAEMSNSVKSDVTEAWNTVQDFAKTNGVSVETALNAALAAQIGGGAVISASVDGKLTGSASDSESTSLADKASHDQRVMSAMETLDSARESTGWSNNKSETNSSDSGQRYSLEDGKRMAQAALRSLSEAETAASGLAYLESHGASASVNINNAVADRLTEMGYQPWQVLNSSKPDDLKVINEVVGDVADGITAQAVKEAQSGVETFKLDDDSVQGVVSMPLDGSANLGGTTVDSNALRTGAREGYDSAKKTTDQRFSDLDSTAQSNAQRDEYVKKSTEIVEGSDTTKASRLSAKVISETAQLLGIEDSQAEWLLKNDPEFKVNTQDALVYYRENYDELKAKVQNLPVENAQPAQPPSGALPLPGSQQSNPNLPVSPTSGGGAGEAYLVPASFKRDDLDAANQASTGNMPALGSSLPSDTVAVDLSAPVQNYSPEERDAMVRTVMASAGHTDMPHLIATALAIKNGTLESPADPSRADYVDENSKIYKAAAYASDLAMSGAITEVPPALLTDTYMMGSGGGRMADLIVETALAVGADPLDLATAISYETAGTFSPTQKGPVTQYGQHEGLIQFGEPQAARYGADFSSNEAALESQLGPDGAVAKYLRASGFEPGMGFADLYSTINAGAPGRYDRTDANNGGALGTVMDKVNSADMAQHRAKAAALLGLTGGDNV